MLSQRTSLSLALKGEDDGVYYTKVDYDKVDYNKVDKSEVD